MYIYPENLKAKPMLWLWLLRDIAIIGVAALISVLSLVQGVGMAPLVVTVLYAFLSPFRWMGPVFWIFSVGRPAS